TDQLLNIIDDLFTLIHQSVIAIPPSESLLRVVVVLHEGGSVDNIRSVRLLGLFTLWENGVTILEDVLRHWLRDSHPRRVQTSVVLLRDDVGDCLLAGLV